MRENGDVPALRTIARLRPSDPTHVRYRGQVRRIYGVIPARHQEHRHFVLRYKQGCAPEYSHQAAIGTRGQAHVVGVLVRADHVVPVRMILKRKPPLGRPKLRRTR